MLNFYHENGRQSLFTNLRVPSLMSSLKALLVLVCLQFVCTSAMAQSLNISAQIDAYRREIKANYSCPNAATIRLFKLGDHYMHGNNATPLATKYVSKGSGYVTFDSRNLAKDAYVLNIVCNGKNKTTSYFVVDNNSKNKLTGIRRNGNYVVVDYEKEQSQKGGYTVMRFASATTGRIFNEQAYDPTVLKGSVNIYCEGPQFKSDTYVISMVVDGVVYDQKKIMLYYY